MKLKGRSLSTLLDISQNEFFYLLELAHKVKKEKLWLKVSVHNFLGS